MKILFVSDLHLPIGPRAHLHPGLRKNLRWTAQWGQRILDRFDHKLREEALRISEHTAGWLQSSDMEYDIIINGGDNTMPLLRHDDRISTVGQIWQTHLERYGESRYFAVSGNHELGHGYNPEPASLPGLLNLREELFLRPINKLGFGFVELHQKSRLLMIDSEIAWIQARYPDIGFFRQLNRAMHDVVVEATAEDHSLLVVTHNTQRTRAWIEKEGLWNRLWNGGRKVVMLGGHFHVPRTLHQDGVEILWAGGGSYSEPIMKHFSRVPFTGFLSEGPGAIEVEVDYDSIRAQHLPFARILPALPKAA